MAVAGVNLEGGIWIADGDYWSRTVADQVNSSKVWNSAKDYDMANGEGTWGDITRGYASSVLSGVIETTAPVAGASSPWASAGLVMEFDARDCSG